MTDKESPAKVVFVCLVFHPDSSASSLLFTDLFRRLAQRGAGITVLTGFPSKDTGEEVARLPRHEWLDGVKIVRCGLRVQGKRSLVTRLLAYASFLAHAGWHLLRSEKHARVVGGTDPPFTSIVLWLLSLVARFDYEAILLDMYPDGFVGLGRLGERSIVTRSWRALNRLSFQRARRLTVIGRDMVSLLHRRYQVDPAGIAYVPHWGTSEVESPAMSRRGALLSRFNLEDKFVVQYSGNMGLWHDMGSFVRAAAELQDEERIHFLFIGKGRRRGDAERLSRELGTTNITWLDFLPREQLPESLTSCDVSLISLRQGLEGVAVPSKLYGILASGRPVIAQVPSCSEVAYVVNEECCGIVIEPGDVPGLCAAVKRLAADPILVRRMGDNALAAYRSKYTIDHAVSTFKDMWKIA